MRVAAVDAAAEAAGIIPGITLADARALVPALAVAPSDAVADARELAALADWCGRYSPWTSSDSSAGEGGAGLWIDITGCAHLFGGEEAMLADLIARLERIGYRARAALADSAGAAWTVARFASPTKHKSWHVIAPGQAQATLAGFPVAGLRLAAEAVATLERLGLKTIGDLEAAPRATLAARFGKDLVVRLDQAMGRCREPISPRQPVASIQARVVFAEPIGHLDDVERATRQLIEKACVDLGRIQHGARKLVLAVYRVDGKMVTVGIGTSRAVRDPNHLMRLFSEHLDKLDLGFGADVMALFVTVSDPLDANQLNLKSQRSNVRFHKSPPPRTFSEHPPSWRRQVSSSESAAQRDSVRRAEREDRRKYPSPLSEADVEAAIGQLAEPTASMTASMTPAPQVPVAAPILSEADVEAAIDQLTDQLGNRLGADNVVRFAPHASYLPERAVVAFSPLGSPLRSPHRPPLGSSHAARPDSAQPDPMLDIEIPWTQGMPRPLSLFLRPEPIEAVAPVPDDPPVLFRWRKQLHRVAWAEGPERLSTEWWREVGLSAMPEALRTRDYFRVEDTSGRRFWLYRNGLYRQSAAAPILVVSDRDAEPEKPHSNERRQVTAVPKVGSKSGFKSGSKAGSKFEPFHPPAIAARPAAGIDSAPTWFVHGLFA